MTRTVKASDERRRELIATAEKLFYTKGYESTSVSDIVNSVGVAQGTFYYYFDSKTAVLEAIVDEAVEQTQAILHEIIADETLTALPKWQQAMQATSNWKIEHKGALIEIGRLLLQEENVLFEHKLRKEVSAMTAREFAKIITQGAEEGVFTTQFEVEAAEIVVAVMATLGDRIGELLINLDDYEDPFALAQRKNTVVQTAIERILGAPTGSLPIIDSHTLTAWFTE